MTIYLAIITTVLVATQVIRVTQNWIQLRRMGAEYTESRAHMARWRKVVKKLDMWLDYTLDELKEQQVQALEEKIKKPPAPWEL